MPVVPRLYLLYSSEIASNGTRFYLTSLMYLSLILLTCYLGLCHFVLRMIHTRHLQQFFAEKRIKNRNDTPHTNQSHHRTNADADDFPSEQESNKDRDRYERDVHNIF